MTDTTQDLAAALLRDVPIRGRINTGGNCLDELVLKKDVLAALSAHLDGVTERAGEVLEGVTPAPDAILAAPVTHLGVNTDGVIDDDVYALMVETEAGGSIIQGLREAMEYTKGMLGEPPAPDAAEAEVEKLRGAAIPEDKMLISKNPTRKQCIAFAEIAIRNVDYDGPWDELIDSIALALPALTTEADNGLG